MRTLFLAACLLLIAASLAAARPPGPAPKQGSGPPPAWLEKPGADRWLAYSSYCWTTMCADFIAPQLRKDLPRISLARGTVVRFHFGCNPSSARLWLVGTNRTWRLTPARVTTWTVAARGIYALEISAGPGSAGYVFRIV